MAREILRQDRHQSSNAGAFRPSLKGGRADCPARLSRAYQPIRAASPSTAPLLADCTESPRQSESWATNPPSPAVTQASPTRPPVECKTLSEKLREYQGALDAAELAVLLGVSKKSVFKMAKRGMIPSFRAGTCLRFCPGTVAGWLAQQ